MYAWLYTMHLIPLNHDFVEIYIRNLDVIQKLALKDTRSQLR